MSVQPAVAPPMPPTIGPAVPVAHRVRIVGHAIARLMPLAGAAGRGLAVGGLAVTLVCAAFATQILHSGVRLIDWTVGVLLVALPLLVLFAALRIPTALLARALRRLGRRTTGRWRRLLLAPLPVLRLIGHPLVAFTAGAALLIWAVPTGGPLAGLRFLFPFEIPIVAGAIGGLFAGVGFNAGRAGISARVARVMSTASLTLALLVVGGVGAWALMPGFGDPVVREAPSTLAVIPELALPDPSQPGPYRVATASYGSGTDSRRAEFGRLAAWRTPTVDASAALGDRGIIEPYARWYWGFDAAQLPLNALVWYPSDATGRLPVALIAHGNHEAGANSDPGYAYLAEHLASRGIIAVSVDENFLNGDALFDYGGREMGTRAWLLLGHLDQLRTWDGLANHPLAGRVDLDRVALIGHSRGGEAVAVAAMLEADPDRELPGLPPIPRGFGIRAVVAIAPSDGMYRGAGPPVALHDLDYLVMQGARDGDLPGFSGLAAYHRVDVGGEDDHLKVALYSGRANHGRFNSVWDYGDAGALSSWMLDRGSVLPMAEQQRLAKTVIGAFLGRSLDGQTGYDAFFREPRAGRHWLPDDVVQTHWQSSDTTVVEQFSTVDEVRYASTGFTTARSVTPPLRDGTPQRDRALLLTSPDEGGVLTVTIDPSVARVLTVDDLLVFAMSPARQVATTVDPMVELHSQDGRVAAVLLSSVAPSRPLVPVQLWKLPGLGDRYLPQERHRFPAEYFLQTYDIPLSAILADVPGFELADVVSVAFRFSGESSVYLDDVGFEPGA